MGNNTTMNKNHYKLSTITALLVSTLLGCSARNSHWNEPLSPSKDFSQHISKASIDVNPRGAYENTLFILANSGGGSRAAYFSAMVMLKLQEIELKGLRNSSTNLLAEVNAISAVSGGTLPAALYAISIDSNENSTCSSQNESSSLSFRPKWDHLTVRKSMVKNFHLRWIYRWFLPQNIGRFWFTAFDRSDIMTQVFANELFDRKWSFGSYTFGDICNERPNLIINATNTTNTSPYTFGDFGNRFTFTTDNFEHLQSNLNHLPIANAVMSSSAFPAVFNHTTLRNFNEKQEGKFIHLFDGGNSDNLGLESAIEIINANKDKFHTIIVLLIDSYTKPIGTSSQRPEPSPDIA